MFSRLHQSEIIIHLKQLFSFLKKCGIKFRFIFVSVFLSLGLTYLTLYSVSLLFPLIDGIIKNHFGGVRNLFGLREIVDYFPNTFNSSTRLFILLIVWVYLTIIIKNIFYYGAFLSAGRQARVATIRLRELLLQKCLSFGKSFYDKYTTTYLHGVLTKSTNVVESQFRLFQELIIQILLLITYLFVMFRISIKLTLVSLIIFPIIHVCMRKVVTMIRNSAKKYSEASLNLNEKISNILFGMPVIKSFVKENEELLQFNILSQREVDQSFKMQRLTTLINPLQDLGSTTGLLLVALTLAMLLKLDAGLTPASAFVFFYLALKLLPSLNAFNNFKIGMAGAISSVNDIELVLGKSDSFIVPQGKTVFPGFSKTIEFKNLTFTYPDLKEPTLKNISFTISKGETVAIVGPTGSGKSTLFNLLFRFYDCPPKTIFIDGVDIRDFDILSLRSHMAHINQEVLLFNNSFKHNVLYANNELEDDILCDITEKVFLTDVVNRLPEKYETFVGDRGNKLSGGEKQRVAVARALIKNPEILVMDEATSSLDSKTELAISDFISEATAGKTVIMIAHRLSTIKKADKIIYLEKGKVAEIGTLNELLNKKGHFASQWEAQKI